MDMVEFVAFMSFGGLAPATIITYMLGVKHHLYLLGAPDFQDSFLFKLTLKGVASTPHEPDVHLAITLPVWEKVLHALPLVHENQYEVCLFSALLTLGFFGLFHPGELVLP